MTTLRVWRASLVAMTLQQRRRCDLEPERADDAGEEIHAIVWSLLVGVGIAWIAYRKPKIITGDSIEQIVDYRKGEVKRTSRLLGASLDKRNLWARQWRRKGSLPKR